MEQHPRTTHSAEAFNVQRGMLREHAHYGADGEAYYGGRGERLAPLVQASWTNEARQLILDFGICLAALPPEVARGLVDEMREMSVAATTGPVPAVRITGDEVAVIQPGANGAADDDTDPYADHPEALVTDVLGIDAEGARERYEAQQRGA